MWVQQLVNCWRIRKLVEAEECSYSLIAFLWVDEGSSMSARALLIVGPWSECSITMQVDVIKPFIWVLCTNVKGQHVHPYLKCPCIVCHYHCHHCIVLKDRFDISTHFSYSVTSQSLNLKTRVFLKSVDHSEVLLSLHFQLLQLPQFKKTVTLKLCK